MKMKAIFLVLTYLISNSCGVERDKTTKEITDEVTEGETLYLASPYDGASEGQRFFDMCTKKFKSTNDLYILDMALQMVDSKNNSKTINCNNLTKLLTTQDTMVFNRLHRLEAIDFYTIAPLKIKNYYFIDINLHAVKNMEQLAYVENFIFNFDAIDSEQFINFSELNKAPALKNIAFNELAISFIADLNPLKNSPNIESIKVPANIKLNLKRNQCPINAKSKALTDFCSLHSN